MDTLIQNTVFTEKANSKQDRLEEMADKQLENFPTSGDCPILEAPSKPTTLLLQLAHIGSLLKELSKQDLPFRIQTKEDIAESEVSSTSSELKPTIVNLTRTGCDECIQTTQAPRATEQLSYGSSS